MSLVDAPGPRWRRWLIGPPVARWRVGLTAISFAAAAASAGLRLGTPGDLAWFSWTVLVLCGPMAVVWAVVWWQLRRTTPPRRLDGHL